MLKLIRHIAVVAGFLMPLCAPASNEPSILTVLMTNGTTYDFYLSSQPVITFDAQRLFISTDDFSAVYEDVEKIYFTNENTTEAETEMADDVKPHVSVIFTDGRHVSVKGCEQTARVAVYAISGVQAGVSVSRSSESIDLDFTSQPAGTYIIKINSQTFKIRTR